MSQRLARGRDGWNICGAQAFSAYWKYQINLREKQDKEIQERLVRKGVMAKPLYVVSPPSAAAVKPSEPLPRSVGPRTQEELTASDPA